MKTHGYHRTPTYRSWESLKARCNGTNDRKRQEWVHLSYDPKWETFEEFLADMGERPEGMTLDRKDNTKGYYKSNCRWATPQQQAMNRSNNHPIPGVRPLRGGWAAYAKNSGGGARQLYFGPDFFEAVCRRKSYEVGL